jgi:hypothetical protein
MIIPKLTLRERLAAAVRMGWRAFKRTEPFTIIRDGERFTVEQYALRYESVTKTIQELADPVAVRLVIVHGPQFQATVEQ